LVTLVVLTTDDSLLFGYFLIFEKPVIESSFARNFFLTIDHFELGELVHEFSVPLFTDPYDNLLILLIVIYLAGKLKYFAISLS